MQDYRIVQRLRLNDREKAYYKLITSSDAMVAVLGDRIASSYAEIVKTIYGYEAKKTLYGGGYNEVSVPLLLHEVCKFDVMVYFRAIQVKSRKEESYTYTIEHKKTDFKRPKIVFRQLEDKELTLHDVKTVANIVLVKEHVVLVMRACERYIVYDNSNIKEFYSVASLKDVYDIVSVYEIYFTDSFEDVPRMVSFQTKAYEPQNITVEKSTRVPKKLV